MNVANIIVGTEESCWQRHLHEGKPEECRRLIAICRPYLECSEDYGNK